MCKVVMLYNRFHNSNKNYQESCGTSVPLKIRCHHRYLKLQLHNLLKHVVSFFCDKSLSNFLFFFNSDQGLLTIR